MIITQQQQQQSRFSHAIPWRRHRPSLPVLQNCHAAYLDFIGSRQVTGSLRYLPRGRGMRWHRFPLGHDDVVSGCALKHRVLFLMESAGDVANAQEQQERLRRFVDEWREQVWTFGDVGRVLDADPVNVTLELRDPAVSVVELINSDSVPLNKLLTVLGFDCVELANLRDEAHAKIYPRLLVFGHSNGVHLEGEVQKAFAKSYLFFYELTAYLSNLKAVLNNLVQQLQALYTPDMRKQVFSSFSTVHFYTAISSLAEGFALLITLDEIVGHNAAIGHAISLIIRMLQTIRAEPAKFGMKDEQIESLDQAITQMDNLLVGGLFQRCLQEDFSLHLEMEKMKGNSLFLEEISFCLRDSMSKISSCIDSSKEQPGDREKLVGLLGLFVVYSWMTDSPDKKTLKAVLKVITRLPVLHPISNVRLLCIEFLTAHSPPWARSSPLFKEVRREAGAVNRSYLTGLDDTLIRDADVTHRTVANWLVSFESLSSPLVQQLSNQSVLDMHLKQITLGILLANRLHRFIRSTIDLHVLLEVPISRDQVRHLRYGMELLKAMQAMYHKKTHELAQSVVHIIEYLRSDLRGRLLFLKSQLEACLNSKTRKSLFNRSQSSGVKEADVKFVDALSAVNLAINMLEGPSTVQGRIIFRLTLDVIIGMQSRLQGDSIEEIRDCIFLIDLASELHTLIDMVTDCSFLYWNREMMATCFSMAYSQADEARLQYLISAFLDGVKLLQAGCAEQSAIESYEKEIQDCLLTELVEPLCHDIETDLRLHVHSAHLKGAVTVNPTKTGVRDLSWFLNLKPLRLTSKYIHIKSRVENYLNAAFYDHAAVALHNWKTYNEMKNLAEHKYGLSLDAIRLPGQTLEQGVDVLEIMRNIHIFVACYTYNLNTQVFVEKPANARNRKHLNTVNVKHVANSIRTHGTGIMSTTVNFTYQFLAQKFVVFSQFLFDDHIKSRMIKEQRFNKEKKKWADSGYPVARAEKLNKDIKKLGLTEDGSSFLDQFRRLIAEMGNALGFVRMVRLGGLHYCSTASGFVADISKKLSFEEVATDLKLDMAGVEAGRILDKALGTQNMSFDQTDYFTILTNVFSQELQNNDNLHLRDFFLIVPALTINAADAILQSKEKLHKRGRDAVNAMFTDDGFALGIAYILKVLGQNKQFDSLHWFQSAKKHFLAERARLEESLDMDNTGSGMNGLQAWSQKLASLSKEEAQNMQLVVKRLTNYLTEVELIEYTFTGARVFYQ